MLLVTRINAFWAIAGKKIFIEFQARALLDQRDAVFFGGAGIAEVELDPDALRAAVVNLLRNAREASRAGDEILVASRRVGDEVFITVTDTGAGMTPEVKARALEPYFSTKSGGNGLGLAMVKRVVEEHGGTIEVDSEVGKGTQFRLRFPAGSG